MIHTTSIDKIRRLKKRKKITLKEALCWFTFTINYFNDRKFTINNKGFIISPDYTKVVPKLGMKRGGSTGNLYIKFNVSFPSELTTEQIKKLEEVLWRSFMKKFYNSNSLK